MKARFKIMQGRRMMMTGKLVSHPDTFRPPSVSQKASEIGEVEERFANLVYAIELAINSHSPDLRCHAEIIEKEET